MFPDNAAALVGAGLLSVLISPVTGLTLLERGGTSGTAQHAVAAGAPDGTRGDQRPGARAQPNSDDG